MYTRTQICSYATRAQLAARPVMQYVWYVWCGVKAAAAACCTVMVMSHDGGVAI